MKFHGKQQTVKIEESTKVAEIRDAFGNLKYTVSLNKYDTIDSNYKYKYEVQVVNQFSTTEPLIILTIPEKGSDEVIFDYNIANEIYKDCIKQYTSLVKAETRDFQDIDIYKEQLNYHLTTPKCCKTCKWSRIVPLDKNYPNGQKDFIFGITGKLKCTNPENQKSFTSFNNFSPNYHCQFEHDSNYFQDNPVVNQRPLSPLPSHHTGAPYYKKEEINTLVINPTVDDFGLCPKYVMKEDEYIPRPGDSLTALIDNHIHDTVRRELSGDLSSEISEQISAQLSDSISSVIIPAVGEEIDKQLNLNPPIIEGNRNIADYNNDGVISEDEEFLYNGGNA